MKQIQWYPGHMAKTKRLLQDNIKLVDVIIEFADARIPNSSVNPDFENLLTQKPRIIAYNKSDLADPIQISKWKRYYENSGVISEFIDCKSGKGINELLDLVREAAMPVIQKDLSKGRAFRPIRIMIVGIPNTGKSTFINRIARKASAKTGNKPGVTKGKQWVTINKEMQMLDTPGILWPKFEDEKVALNLAFTGAISDDIMDLPDVAYFLMQQLIKLYPESVEQRYGIEHDDTRNIIDIVAFNKGCIKKGNEPDYDRTAKMILDDFRSGKLGNITLEHI